MFIPVPGFANRNYPHGKLLVCSKFEITPTLTWLDTLKINELRRVEALIVAAEKKCQLLTYIQSTISEHDNDRVSFPDEFHRSHS